MLRARRRPPQSSRWPAEPSPREQVEMDVEHGLSRVAVHIEDRPVWDAIVGRWATVY